METAIIKLTGPDLDPLHDAAKLLREAKLVAFPTETVYGLGAIYSDDDAVYRIFAVKGRPNDNPLILHIWHHDQLLLLTTTIHPKAEKLIDRFWPGPLTVVFPKSTAVSPVITAGLSTVAVRMPSHPVAQELLRLTNIPVAAPSANLSGRPSPTRGEHVIEDLDGKIEMILDAGSCQSGLESTVVMVDGEHPLILRPGSVTREMLEEVLGEPVQIASSHPDERPPAPGMKYRHYAPKAPVFLVEGSKPRIIQKINELLKEQSGSKKSVVIAATENMQFYPCEWVLDLGPSGQPEIAAERLYELLRLCDRLNTDIIFIEGLESNGVGGAVMNRLRKAAEGNVIHVS